MVFIAGIADQVLGCLGITLPRLVFVLESARPQNCLRSAYRTAFQYAKDSGQGQERVAAGDFAGGAGSSVLLLTLLKVLVAKSKVYCNCLFAIQLEANAHQRHHCCAALWAKSAVVCLELVLV